MKIATLAELERAWIERTLELTHGNKTQAAKRLGIGLRTLRNKLNLYRRQDDEKRIGFADVAAENKEAEI